MDRLEGKVTRIKTRAEKEGRYLQSHLTWSYASSFDPPARNWLESWLAQEIIVDDAPASGNKVIQAHATERKKLELEARAKSETKQPRKRAKDGKGQPKKRI